MKYRGMTLDSVDLELYRDPDLIVNFISYVKERGVHYHHMVKHISLARKILDFLQSGSAPGSEIRNYTSQMDAWLNLLARQLVASAPVSVSEALPSHSKVQAWCMYKVRSALEAIEFDMKDMNCLTSRSAAKVQESVIASLICGAFFPPIRLSIIKSLTHPKYKGCWDPDCLEGPCCRGNHILLEAVKDAENSQEHSGTWLFGYGPSLRMTLVISHSKNDRFEYKGFGMDMRVYSFNNIQSL